MRQQLNLPALLLLTASIAIAGCNNNPQASAEASSTEAPAAAVSVLQVMPQAISLTENLPARVQALKVAEIRPQVGGIIEKVLFTQGAEVQAGQALFRINADIFQADVNSSKAALQKAQAEAARLKTQLERYQQLLPVNAISKQELNDIQAQHRQALADVAQMQAALSRQQLNLQYATVRAPISGRIGKLLVTEGALVSQNDSNAMAIVQQIDKVYLDVKQSIADYEQLQEALSHGQLSASGQHAVQVVNTQGQTYPVSGKILFSDTNVDPETGDVTIRIEVNNPARKLLPGMYARVNIQRASIPNALLVPEQAVIRDMNGQPQLAILAKDQTAEVRPVQLGQQHQSYYVVSSGLKAGEQVIVEGQERATPGQKLKASVWQAPQAAPETGTQGSHASTARVASAQPATAAGAGS